MNKTEQHIFFHLLRTALWQREPDATPFQSEDWQWRNILIALDNHALLALAADAIMTINDMLPPAKQLNPMQSMNLMQHCASVAQTHYDLNAAVIKSFAQLQQVGCTPILLKGQGLATLYPIKNTRSCGDIDIYVGRTDYEKAKSFFNAQCTPEEIAAVEEDSHQYHIKHGRVTYELHPIAGHSADSSCQKKYNKWAEEWLKQEKCDSAVLEYAVAENNGNELVQQSVPVPNVQFNILYVFDHLCRHLHFQGVGVRQFVDVAILLKSAYGKLDEVQFKHDLKQLGLFRAWKILSGILVYNLGLPEHMCPFFDTVYASKSQGRILETVLQDSNFGADSEWRHEASRHSHGKERMQMKLSEQYKKFKLNYLLFPSVAIKDFFSYSLGGVDGFIRRHI